MTSRVLIPALALVGCERLDNPPLEPLPRDETFFNCEVQPVLARDCAFPACHGNSERPLSLYAPGRMRMTAEYAIARAATPEGDLEAGVHPALTAVEVRHNYLRAMAFVRPDGAVADSPLLALPLAVAAGGRYHAPNADVFPSPDAPGYLTIARWLRGEVATGACP